jgi:hypothetical protein
MSKHQKPQCFDDPAVAWASEPVRNFLLHPLDRTDPRTGHKRRAHVEHHLLPTGRPSGPQNPSCSCNASATRPQFLQGQHLQAWICVDRHRKPKQLAGSAKNPWETRVFERRGQEPNNLQIPLETSTTTPCATRNPTRAHCEDSHLT